MKVLITIGENQFKNPFVRILALHLRELSVEVVCSVSEFWNNWRQYDIIHIQWPHLLVECQTKSADQLVEVLKEIKKSQVKIVATCHNLHPHFSNSANKEKSYKTVYKYADAITHLGEYSYNLFCKDYPSAKNVIIMHHIYEDLYDLKTLPTKKEAYKKLQLSDHYKYILCMGAFRNKSEKDLLLNIDTTVQNVPIKILAPTFEKGLTFSLFHPKGLLISMIKWINLRFKYKNVICDGNFVSDELLPYYYAACDIALIQRTEILNSGNVPMALMMGKVVVGPNTGNVGTWLNNINNPTFEIKQPDSIRQSIQKAFDMTKAGKGLENQKYALENLSPRTIANQYLLLYKNMI